MTALFALRGATKRYPGVCALDGVDFVVAAGEVHGLVGENGAGKSTLLKLLAGVVQPDAGTLEWRGEVRRWRGPADALAAGIRLIHQELNLVPMLTVAENLFLGREPRRFGFVRRRQCSDEAAQLLGGLGVSPAIDVHARVADLTVGQQQMVEIAKALGAQAQLIAMDEPTSALTVHEAERLMELIDRLKQGGVGIIYVSHRLDEIARLCDRVTVLRDGHSVAIRAQKELSSDELTRLMVGRAPPPPSARPPVHGDRPAKSAKRAGEEVPSRGEAEVALRVDGLERRGAFAPISFDVRRGEILGIAGLMGAGRSELLRAIFGADRATGGRVLVDGEPLPLGRPAQAIARGLVLLPEDRKREGLLLDLSVRENLSLPSLDRLARAGWVRRAAERAAADRWISELAVRTPSREQIVGNLSGGNQQKIVLGKWLQTQPRVLLLDEPTRGIDVGGKAEIHALIRRLADEGMALVVVSSELPELLALSDRIAALHEGRLTGVLTRAAAGEEALLRLMMGQNAA
jgi:ribose transport system ATP-binding protein